MKRPGFSLARGAATAAGLSALSLLAACGHRAPAVAPVTPVITTTARAVDADASDSYPGDVHARYETDLSFRVAGKLARREVNPGEQVHAGQTLAELDDTDAASAAASAKAALAAADSRYEYAAQQLSRDQAQHVQNLISEQQWEQTRDNFNAAVGSREQARQQLQQAQDQLRYNHLIADHDGTVTNLQADVGTVLSAGQAVFGFAQAGEREVQVQVPETRVGQLHLGQSAQVRFPALLGYVAQAQIREIAGAADAQARSYLVKLTLTTPSPLLALGMTAQATLASTQISAQAVRIPSTALFHQGDRPAVWVLGKDSTLSLRPVQVARYEERYVLLSGGLQAGETLLAQGVHMVAEGEHVQPIAPPHPEDAPQ